MKVEIMRSALPVEGAFFQSVNVTDEENAEEGKHGTENQIRIGEEHFLVNDGTWVEEYDFDIEEDEEHRDEVEFDGEAGVAFADGEHAAFVGSVFDFVAAAELADGDGKDEVAAREKHGDGGQH